MITCRVATFLKGKKLQMSNEITSAPETYTADQLYVREDDGHRYELVNGVLNMMSPAGSEHGWIANNLSLFLSIHVREKGIGRVYAAETGFLISRDPDTVRAADACFVSHESLATVEPSKAYLPLAPDLVIEVVSPSDSSSDVESKAELWLECGSQLVLVADPATQTIRVYENKSEIHVYHTLSKLDAVGRRRV